MKFTKDIMLPFMLSQQEIAVEKNNRIWLFEFHNNSTEKWSHSVFQKTWSFLRSDGTLKETVEDECLIVHDQNITLEVTSVPNITRYCHYNTVSCVPHTWKHTESVTREKLPEELQLEVISCVKEVEDIVQPDVHDWEKSNKSYVLEKRFVYENDVIRYILSMKRTSTHQSSTMSSSGVTTAPMMYEFMMEYKDIQSTDVVIVLEYIVQFMQFIHDDNVAISKQQVSDIIDGYLALVKTKMHEGRRNRDNQPTAPFFFAPKPITMERMHLADPASGYGVISVQSGYTVTEKADGERYLFYIHNDGNVYLINNTFDIKATGKKVLSRNIYSTLIDGEYITADKRTNNTENDLFMAFDIYFLGGEAVMDLPLLDEGKPSRYSKLVSLLESKDVWTSGRGSALDIDYKRHISAEGAGMFEACREILTNTAKFPYSIDGLIFTPQKLPVFGYYPNRPVKVTDNVKWDRVLKWKPSDQNTIDFLVQGDETVRVHPITKESFVVMKLFTGYNSSQWEPISVLQGLRIKYDRQYANMMRTKDDVYRAKLFTPISYYEKGVEEAHIPLKNGVVIAENGDIIENNMIVEFAYDPNKSVHASRRWVPLRVREDKNRILRSGKLSKTANDLTVAMSIWRSIHNPVTFEMITGLSHTRMRDIPDELEERILGVDDTYYAREVPRQHMLSVHMLNFHNQGIKKMLYERSGSRNSLLELACGMAGDLPRWRDAHYKFILGVDLVRDNIVHPREGSYARVQRQHRAVMMVVNGITERMYPDIVFAIGDCALPLRDGTASKDLDDESYKVIRHIYGQRESFHGSNINYFQRLKGKASRGFDVVSCQFAIHYFFKNEDSLMGFLSNVSTNLVREGVFIATFMDGDSVQDLLNQSDNGIAEGRKLDDKVVAWAIIKRYTDARAKFGKMVDVYLENTNRLISEYIVNLDTLIDYAKQFGLQLADTGLFSQTFNELKNLVPENPDKYSMLDNDIITLDGDEVQKRFSFLNRWVVFKKL